MSLLTRCPACTTLYKVVPDQLRISQGWVKCGQCGEIFDASLHLMEASTEPEDGVADSATESAVLPAEADADADQSALDGDLQPSATEMPWPTEPPPDDQSATPSTTSTALDADPVADIHDEANPIFDPEPELEATYGVSHEFEQVVDHHPVMHEDSAPIPPEWEPLNLPGEVPEFFAPGPEVAMQAQAESPPEQDPTQPTSDAQASEHLSETQPSEASDVPSPVAVSFMQDGNSKFASAPHPHAKSAMLSLAGVLTLALGAQWVYQDHDRLAAATPQWRPALENICKPLRCTVKPWQQIESIAIDAAAFTKAEGDRYRLSFTLKNAAPLPLAWPSIELTLTDVQDRVVIRRVLSPPEMAVASPQLLAHADWPVVVDLQVTPKATSEAFVGYRLLAFYP